jgi:hypothetical protein
MIDSVYPEDIISEYLAKQSQPRATNTIARECKFLPDRPQMVDNFGKKAYDRDYNRGMKLVRLALHRLAKCGTVKLIVSREKGFVMYLWRFIKKPNKNNMILANRTIIEKSRRCAENAVTDETKLKYEIKARTERKK